MADGMEQKGTILLVEDNQKLNTANRRALESRGHTVAVAETLAEARAWLRTHRPDVILLDVMLPDGDGFRFCREIREETTAHILFLTARTTHGDLARGLSGGGDDYIRKPFHPGELLARVEAAIRRQNMAREKQTLVRGPLTLDTVAARAFLHGKDMLLGGKEFAVLLCLVRHEGETLSKEALYESVWGQPMAGDSNALYMAVSRLKRKLAHAEAEGIFLSARRGEGYRFTCGSGDRASDEQI